MHSRRSQTFRRILEAVEPNHGRGQHEPIFCQNNLVSQIDGEIFRSSGNQALLTIFAENIGRLKSVCVAHQAFNY